ncbi:MAG: nucleotide sugar dehydrogenase [Chloroflexi bacterium]|nr:nucleotide sugar dehydrogenase [Chloroflexota bacterium]
MARVCVVGLGYVGLPIAAVLSSAGHSVIGVDTNPRVLEALARGCTIIREPGLDTLVAQGVASGRLVACARPQPAEAFILAVPTPVRGLANKRADLRFVAAAAESVAPVLKRGNLVILESTSPPGTTAEVVGPILERGSGLQAGQGFLLAHCPERILPGNVLHELVHNDRVIGGVDRASAETARDLYASFVQGEVFLTDATTAELVKLMENTYRDVNIALANEFALVARHLGVNAWEAIELANRHPRVQILRPGPGVGGHCIAVDPWFVVGAAPRFTPLITASRAVNDAMPLHVADLVADVLGGLAGRRIVTLGMTYKANVDDTRESPAAEVVEHLQHAGAEVRLHDAMVAADLSVEELAVGADCLVLLVDHQAYADLDPSMLAPLVRRLEVVDTRNFLSVERWTEAGFRLTRLGDGRRRAAIPGVGAPA